MKIVETKDEAVPSEVPHSKIEPQRVYQVVRNNSDQKSYFEVGSYVVFFRLESVLHVISSNRITRNIFTAEKFKDGTVGIKECSGVMISFNGESEHE